MRKFLRKFQTFWLEDLSFVLLLVMLVLIFFVIPIIMVNSTHGIMLFNIMLLCVFFSGIFSSRNKWLILASSVLFIVHCTLRWIRFDDNPYSFYILENMIAVLNTLVFMVINLRLLFRNESVNVYRIIGAINVYLLFALMGVLLLEMLT